MVLCSSVTRTWHLQRQSCGFNSTGDQDENVFTRYCMLLWIWESDKWGQISDHLQWKVFNFGVLAYCRYVL
jgi:hypothetical protein